MNIRWPSPQLIQYMTIDRISFKRFVLHKFWCMICVISRYIYRILGTLEKYNPKLTKFTHYMYVVYVYIFKPSLFD